MAAKIEKAHTQPAGVTVVQCYLLGQELTPVKTQNRPAWRMRALCDADLLLVAGFE